MSRLTARRFSINPKRVARITLSRRRFCGWLLVPAAQLLTVDAWAVPGRIASARLWPAAEYTRLIVEAATPLSYRLQVLKNPDRLVLDLADVDWTTDLADIGARVQASDPYVAGIRVGRLSGSGVRIVLDLKTPVDPQAFALAPVAEFGHRVVLDLYPLTPLDPLMALLESERWKEEAPATIPPAQRAPSGPVAANPPAAAAPPVAADRNVPSRDQSGPGSRRITIAVDPGMVAKILAPSVSGGHTKRMSRSRYRANSRTFSMASANCA